MTDDRGRYVGAFPAAVDPGNPQRIVSHPGLTYGGVVHDGRLFGEHMLGAVRQLCDHYANQGYTYLEYKVVPHIYHRLPAQDDLYALFRLGATRSRVDLSCAIDLFARGRTSERRRRTRRKADSVGVRVDSGTEYATTFWPILERNLRDRHDAAPAHSLDELHELMRRFPDQIELAVANAGDEMLAGVILFRTGRVVHAQYIGSSEEGRKIGALDVVFEHEIERARLSGAAIFDFGISTTDRGNELNQQLYEFKHSFGGGGVVHEFYELRL